MLPSWKRDRGELNSFFIEFFIAVIKTYSGASLIIRSIMLVDFKTWEIWFPAFIIFLRVLKL